MGEKGDFGYAEDGGFGCFSVRLRGNWFFPPLACFRVASSAKSQKSARQSFKKWNLLAIFQHFTDETTSPNFRKMWPFLP